MNVEKTIFSVPGWDKTEIPAYTVHTLILGSGAAGLNAAVQLKSNGVSDVLIVTEGLDMGTSINTGSDKQTYYKLGLFGADGDSPVEMARTFFDGGGMHGDIALCEAALSARAFLNLVNLGVPFPRDRYGQFVGYKTDHDPRQRATSMGPYTSREMCRALIAEVKKRDIPVHEKRIAVALVTVGTGDARRAAGMVALNLEKSDLAAKNWRQAVEIYMAENVVFATGGPGGIYSQSVYPKVHTGGIGLALLAGAKARNLPESQFGMASTKFRWNVSGTYMQVIPRFISTGPDGQSDPKEFLCSHFADPGRLHGMIFLKGYQWPFDAAKVPDGSSIVDILVYVETVIRKRRVFLDYRENPAHFDFAKLPPEARRYLENSHALLATPIERLAKMNSPAIDLYRDNGIDITTEPLEIAVSAQHNNGGLAGNIWWESENIRHLFPVGEVNGSHGVARPGGSALNSGQVGGIRAAEFIAARYREWTLDRAEFYRSATAEIETIGGLLAGPGGSGETWRAFRAEFQERMSRSGAQIRGIRDTDVETGNAWRQFERIARNGLAAATLADLAEGLRNRQLCFAHAVYLDAIRSAIAAGVGSRGSALVVDLNDEKTGPFSADGALNFRRENVDFRGMVLDTVARGADDVESCWSPRRVIPSADGWFENAWADFRTGRIYADSE